MALLTEQGEVRFTSLREKYFSTELWKIPAEIKWASAVTPLPPFILKERLSVSVRVPSELPLTAGSVIAKDDTPKCLMKFWQERRTKTVPSKKNQLNKSKGIAFFRGPRLPLNLWLNLSLQSQLLCHIGFQQRPDMGGSGERRTTRWVWETTPNKKKKCPFYQHTSPSPLKMGMRRSAIPLAILWWRHYAQALCFDRKGTACYFTLNCNCQQLTSVLKEQ